MANEISITIKLDLNKDSLEVFKNPIIKVDMDGNDYTAETFLCSATAELIPVSGEVTQAGWAFFRNLSDTDYIELSTQSGGGFGGNVFCYLYPGEPALLPILSTSIYARCTDEYGGTARLDYVILDR